MIHTWIGTGKNLGTYGFMLEKLSIFIAKKCMDVTFFIIKGILKTAIFYRGYLGGKVR